MKTHSVHVLGDEDAKDSEHDDGQEAVDGAGNGAGPNAGLMSSFITVVAGDLLSLGSTSAATIVVIRVLILIAHTLSAAALWADSFATTVILAADKGTANVIGRVSAAILDLALSSSKYRSPCSNVCLDLLLNHYLRRRSRLLHHHGLRLHHAGLLNHARLLHHHSWLRLDHTWLLHHHRLLLHHAWLGGHLDHAWLGGLACLTDDIGLSKRLVRDGRLATWIDLHLFSIQCRS